MVQLQWVGLAIELIVKLMVNGIVLSAGKYHIFLFLVSFQIRRLYQLFGFLNKYFKNKLLEKIFIIFFNYIIVIKKFKLVNKSANYDKREFQILL
jgi:hypothetical protein